MLVVPAIMGSVVLFEFSFLELTLSLPPRCLASCSAPAAPVAPAAPATADLLFELFELFELFLSEPKLPLDVRCLAAASSPPATPKLALISSVVAVGAPAGKACTSLPVSFGASLRFS